jgi:hypothetical protein
VYEDVFATFLLDEAETLSVVEPFNLAFCHFLPPFSSGVCAGSSGVLA